MRRTRTIDTRTILFAYQETNEVAVVAKDADVLVLLE